MKNAKQYRKLYEQKAQECFCDYGYYYPPRTWEELTAWDAASFEKYLSGIKRGVEKTTAYLGLLDSVNALGFYIAFEKPDYQLLNDVLFQSSRYKLLHSATMGSGTDHSLAFWELTNAFACNDFDVIDYFLPQHLPLSKGQYYFEVAANLLKGLYYNDSATKETAVRMTEKFLKKNIAQWERYIISYLKALVESDLQRAIENLQLLCGVYRRMEHFGGKYATCFASEVHGLYRLARQIDPDFFSQLTRPSHDCFFEEFEVWQQENKYPQGRLFYNYPQDLDYMNKILSAKLPVVALVNSVQPKGKPYKDADRFALDLTTNTEAKY